MKREIGERDGRITALDEERRTLASKVALAGKERAAIEARSASVETGWRHRYEELQAQVRSLAEELEWRIEDGEQARRDLEEEQLRCKALERDVDELTADLQRTRVQTVRQVPVPKITPLSCSTRLELARERLEHTLFEGRQYRPAPVELGSGGEESHPELMHTRAPVPTTPAIDSVVNRLPSAATPRRDNKAETQATTPTVIPAAASPAIVAQARETVPEESRQTTTTRNEPAMASSSMPEETQPAERVDDKAVDDVEKVPVKPELKSAANDADDEPVTKEGTTDLEVLAAMTGVVEQASAPARWPDMTNDVDIAIQQQQEEVVDEQKREAERRRQEMIEKQREERVLRAAQQRRERDERDRQMRAASAPARRQQPQRQQPQRPSASASVNLAPPERRKLAVAEQDAAGTEQKIDTEPDDPLEEYKRRVMERMRQQQGADQHQSQTLPLPPESDDELAFSGPDEHDEP